MTGWEAALEWSAGGPNRFVQARVDSGSSPEGVVEVTVGLTLPVSARDLVYERAMAGTLDEAAAAALAAWRKRML